MGTRKHVPPLIVRKGTLFSSVSTAPFIICLPCTATWPAIIGRSYHRLFSSRTTRHTPKRWRRLPTLSCVWAYGYSPVELILGVPSTDAPQNKLDYSRRTVENLQLAYELARRNLQERADKQAVENKKLSFPSFKVGDKVLLHRPYHETDGPNPRLVSPWHGPYTVRTQLSPVIHRVSKPNEPVEVTIHLGRMKQFVKPKTSPAPDFEALDDMFLGTTLPVRDLDGSMHTVTIGLYVIEAIDGHKRGLGAASVENFQYQLKLKGQPPQCGVWRHCSTPSMQGDDRILPCCNSVTKSFGFRPAREEEANLF